MKDSSFSHLDSHLTLFSLFFFCSKHHNIALGTLYAYQNAIKLAKSLYSIDLEAGLKDGSLSIGLYHTAEGTRLAPLPGAENNNKPGVKLAATVKIGGEDAPVTILEG